MPSNLEEPKLRSIAKLPQTRWSWRAPRLLSHRLLLEMALLEWSFLASYKADSSLHSNLQLLHQFLLHFGDAFPIMRFREVLFGYSPIIWNFEGGVTRLTNSLCSSIRSASGLAREAETVSTQQLLTCCHRAKLFFLSTIDS